MNDLTYLSANDVLAAFRAKRLSPVEYLGALVERIELLEPTINAVAERRYEEALAEARSSQARYARKSGTSLALDGLPVAVKEEQPMAGRSWKQGSLTLADEVATIDHPVVERIQAAGGIVHIRTTTPEFSCAGFCHSRMWGVTRNPWNADYSPGGSSGGSAAALAAGYAPLATGSDIGGSIRVPASLSGVVGFKPPWARVPALPPYNLDQYCHDGPMARTVDDCALIEDVIAGRHWRDVASLPGPPKLLDSIGDCRGVRVAVCPTLGDWPLAGAVAANTQSVAVALAEAGCIVEQVSLPWSIDEIWAAAQAHFRAIMGTGIAHVEHAHGDLLNDYTRAFARDMTAEGLGFYEGLELEGRLWEPLGRIFESFDVVLCPTMATDGFLAGESYLEGGMTIGDGHVHHHILGAMTLPFNLFSRCPVLSVPSGRAANGVPTGVQVVARPYDDIAAFVVARAVEATGFGFTHADWRPPIG